MLFKKIALFIGIAVAGLPLHVQAQLSSTENEKLKNIAKAFFVGTGVVGLPLYLLAPENEKLNIAKAFFVVTGATALPLYLEAQLLSQGQLSSAEKKKLSLGSKCFFEACTGFYCLFEDHKKLKACEKSIQNEKKDLIDYLYKTSNNLFEARKAEFLANRSILKKVCKKKFFKKRMKYFKYGYSVMATKKSQVDNGTVKLDATGLEDICCAYELNYENDNLLNDLQLLYKNANQIYASEYVNFNVSFHQEGIDSSEEEKFNKYVYNLVHRNSQQLTATAKLAFKGIEERCKNTQVKNGTKRFLHLVRGMGCLFFGLVALQIFSDTYYVN